MSSLNTGSYPASTYEHFYQLTLPESGNVLLGIAHNTGYSAIYDEQLNFVTNITQAPMYLDAGAYIIHADYSNPNSGELSVVLP